MPARLACLSRRVTERGARDGGQALGVIHHVIIRGLERRKIFRDNKDRDDMIDRLADLLPATNTACYVYPV